MLYIYRKFFCIHNRNGKRVTRSIRVLDLIFFFFFYDYIITILFVPSKKHRISVVSTDLYLKERKKKDMIYTRLSTKPCSFYNDMTAHVILIKLR